MLALQVCEPQPVENTPLRLVNIPIPQPQEGQVLVRVLYCGVCHTDLHIVEGDIHPPRLPVTPGHQVAGIIEQVGLHAGEWKTGQRVGLPWLHATCGQCDFCRRGQENLCPQACFTGFHTDGGYAQYCLADARFLLPIPETIPNLQAAPLLCAGIIGYRSLRLAQTTPGCRIGLFGFGASAHLALQLARHWNCEVYVFTRSPQHRRSAQNLGAAWVGGAQDFPPQPLDCAVSFAPAGELIPLILEKLRPGGVLAINAIYLSDIPALPYSLIYGERTLRSVTNATYQDGLEFLNLAAEFSIFPEVTVYPLADANRALFDLKHSRINGQAVLGIKT